MSRKRNLPEGIAVLSIRLPESLHERLRAVASENERTISQEARKALTAHIEAAEAEGAAA